ncbi:hypothetical protein FS559_05230 [Treponema phagedenis]|nr:hypothetical protein FS559_05230 [Treponema phagedenis]
MFMRNPRFWANPSVRSSRLTSGRRAAGSASLRLFLRYFERAKTILLRTFEKVLRSPPHAFRIRSKSHTPWG